MPVVAFACPPDKKKFGQTHDPEYCVTRCDEQCYSPFLMTAIYGVNQRNYHVGRYVSATALSGCKRRLTLERTVDYAEMYNNLYAAFRGTITHTVIEEAVATKFPSGRSLLDMGFVAEWNMVIGYCLAGHGGFAINPDLDVDDLATYAFLSCPECDRNGLLLMDQKVIILGGTLDGGAPVFDEKVFLESDNVGERPKMLIDPDGTAYYKLSDIKTMKEFALKYFVRGDAKNTLHPQIKDDYVRQARVYMYLASRARVPERLAKMGVKKIVFVRSDIQAFAMGEAPWTGGGSFRWKDDWRNPLKDWPMYAIDLVEDVWVEEYVTRNAVPILESLILGNSRGPVIEPEKGNEYHNWLCKSYCAFAGTDCCPNPAIEYAAIKAGDEPEAAFQQALRTPMQFPVEKIGTLDAKDRAEIDNYFRLQRGEETVKVTRERKPRAKKPAASKKPRTKKAKEELTASAPPVNPAS